MSRASCKTALLLIMILAFCLSGLAAEAMPRSAAQDQAKKTEPSPDQEAKTGPSPILEEEIHAGPRDIKEEVGIYVFLGWLWLSIFVMIYLLRHKIREIDRLHSYKYFKVSEKDPPV